MDALSISLITLLPASTLYNCNALLISSRSKSRSSASSTFITPAYWNAIRHPGGAPLERSTKRFCGSMRISSHRGSQSSSSCISCKSSISRTSQSAVRLCVDSLDWFSVQFFWEKSGSPAFRRDIFFPSGTPANSASATTVFPKPQGALKKRTRPCRINSSNSFAIAGFMIICSGKFFSPSPFL